MLFAYMRVSTGKQDVKRQHDNIRRVYSEAELPETCIYADTWTGTTMNRPNWNRLLRRVKTGDCIIFDSVSRMSRDAEEGMKEYAELFERGIELRFMNEPCCDSSVYKSAADKRISLTAETGNEATDNFLVNLETAINQLVLDLAKEQIRIAFNQAEKERDDLSKRTKDGIAAAMKRREETGKPLPTYNRGATLVTRKEKAAKEIILEQSRAFNGTLSDSDCMGVINKRLGCNIARNTYFKYKKSVLADEIAKAGE